MSQWTRASLKSPVVCLVLVAVLVGCHSVRNEKNVDFCRIAEGPTNYTGEVVTVRLRVLVSLEGSVVYDETCPKVNVSVVPGSTGVRVWDEVAQALNYGMADATAHASFTGVYMYLPTERIRHRIVVRTISHIEVHKGVDP